MNGGHVCFECGETDNLHDHHVVPKSLGGTKTIPLCEKCHGLVHGMDFTNHSNLTKAGLDAAKKRGVKLGNPNIYSIRNKDSSKAREKRIHITSVYRHTIWKKIEHLVEKGMSDTYIAKRLNDDNVPTSMGGKWNRTAIYRIRKRYV